MGDSGMTSIRRLFFLVLTLALTAFALPAMAQNCAPGTKKCYTLSMSPATEPAGAQTVTASFVNVSTSISNINSVIVYSPFTITSKPTALVGSVDSWSSSWVKLRDMPGIPVNVTTAVVSIPVNIPSSPGCSQNLWTSEAFTGNAFGGTAFKYITTALTQPYTNVAAGCALMFQQQPHGAQVNKTITSVGSDPTGAPVQVALTDGTNPVAWFNGSITLVIKSGTGTNGAMLSGGSANASAGVATFPGLSINKVGSNYILTAGGGGAMPVDSTPFSIFANGDIGCVGGQTGTTNNYDSSKGKTDYTYDPDGGNTPSGNGWGLRRGSNYVTSNCVLVAYNFDPPTSGNNYVASLLYDRTTGQAASWKYLVTWPDGIAVDPSNPTQGWTTFRPWVSWGIDNPSSASGSTDFVPALFCLDDPGDITQRNAAELLALLPKLPNDCDTNGPFCKANAAHPDVYYLDDAAHPAKMCVSQQGFATGPNNALFPWTEVVDEADGFVRVP